MTSSLYLGLSSPSRASSLEKDLRQSRTVIVSPLVLEAGMGRERREKGSKVTETWRQEEQRREDLRKVGNRGFCTTNDLLKIKCAFFKKKSL